MKRRDVQCPACKNVYSVRKPTWCHCNGNANKCTSVSLQHSIRHVTGERSEPTPTHSE